MSKQKRRQAEADATEHRKQKSAKRVLEEDVTDGHEPDVTDLTSERLAAPSVAPAAVLAHSVDPNSARAAAVAALPDGMKSSQAEAARPVSKALDNNDAKPASAAASAALDDNVDAKHNEALKEAQRLGNEKMGTLSMIADQCASDQKLLNIKETAEHERYENDRKGRQAKLVELGAARVNAVNHMKIIRQAMHSADPKEIMKAIQTEVRVATVDPSDVKGARRAVFGGGGNAAEFSPQRSKQQSANGTPNRNGTIRSPIKVRKQDNSGYIEWLVNTKGAWELKAPRKNATDGPCKGCEMENPDHWANDCAKNAETGLMEWLCPRVREMFDPPVA